VTAARFDAWYWKYDQSLPYAVWRLNGFTICFAPTEARKPRSGEMGVSTSPFRSGVGQIEELQVTTRWPLLAVRENDELPMPLVLPPTGSCAMEA